MIHRQDLDILLLDSVNDYVRQRGDDQFPRVLDLSGPAKIGKLFQTFDSVRNCADYGSRRPRILAEDVAANLLKIVDRFGRPAYSHLGLEQPVDAREHFLMFNEIAAVRRRQAAPNRFDKPRLMLQIEAYDFLGQFVRHTSLAVGELR